MSDKDNEEDSEEEVEDDSEQESSEEDDSPARKYQFAADDATLRRGLIPEVKNEISDITGAPKRVYPPIEPDYDSDSSTEDASPFLAMLI